MHIPFPQSIRGPSTEQSMCLLNFRPGISYEKEAIVTKKLLAALCAAVALLGASNVQVPANMRGRWAHGSCAIAANRLIVTRKTAKLGIAKPAAIYYDPGAGGQGAAIHWNQEYVVDNFVYAPSLNAIVHNTQGFGMPGAVLYKKCAH